MDYMKLLGDNRRQRQITRNVKATIYFDAAFDSKYSRSTSALVVRGEMDEFLASKIVLHSAGGSSLHLPSAQKIGEMVEKPELKEI